MPSGTNTILFISKRKVPAGRIVSYGIIVAKIRLQKAETHCNQLTVRLNLINFPGDVTIPKAYLTTVKLISNTVLLAKNENFVCVDIDNFYFENPMDRY